ncbi:hypothetical protein AB7W14_20615 [Providencia rettgeri]
MTKIWKLSLKYLININTLNAQPTEFYVEFTGELRVSGLKPEKPSLSISNAEKTEIQVMA